MLSVVYTFGDGPRKCVTRIISCRKRVRGYIVRLRLPPCCQSKIPSPTRMSGYATGSYHSNTTPFYLHRYSQSRFNRTRNNDVWPIAGFRPAFLPDAHMNHAMFVECFIKDATWHARSTAVPETLAPGSKGH